MTSSFPGAATSAHLAETRLNDRAIHEATKETANSLPARDVGFTRDQTVGDQVRQAIGGAKWDKKVRIFLHSF
jgi:hypothetical protein